MDCNSSDLSRALSRYHHFPSHNGTCTQTHPTQHQLGRVKRIWYLSPMEQRRFRRACASAQSHQNLRCSLIQAVNQEEPSDRKPDPWPLWMAGHAQLKFVMTECSKTQIRLTRPSSMVQNSFHFLYCPFPQRPQTFNLDRACLVIIFNSVSLFRLSTILRIALRVPFPTIPKTHVSCFPVPRLYFRFFPKGLSSISTVPVCRESPSSILSLVKVCLQTFLCVSNHLMTLVCETCTTFSTWAAPSEFGTYRLCEQRRFRRACASAQSRQNLRCSLIQAVSQEEPSDRKPDPWPLWMAGHAQLKFVMTECSKTQIRLAGLTWYSCISIPKR